MSENIVAVIRWEVHAGQEREFERRWQLDSDVIQTYEGALGTKLHRPLSDSLVYIGCARWESFEQRAKAMELKKVEHPELDLPENSDEYVSNFLSIDFLHEPDIFSNPPTQDLGQTPSESYTHHSVLGGPH